MCVSHAFANRLVDPALLDSSTLGMLSLLFSIALLIMLFSILPIFHLNNSGSLSPCPFHSTYSLPSSVPFAIATRMVVAVSVLILSYSEGKPVTENKAYARCASIKATNVP